MLAANAPALTPTDCTMSGSTAPNSPPRWYGLKSGIPSSAISKISDVELPFNGYAVPSWARVQ